MTDRPHAVPVETLLAQRPWVEALARSLVFDEATADDVVQQTMVAALEHPPREPKALRGWLSRVVRNAASTARLRAKRRAVHEAVVVPRDGDASPEETVARVEAHRKVVDAVMKLEEPYRTAVILRFFEGLESDEVARRTGVPVETARSRIKRALAQLRVRLDRDHGGDGRAWALALAPLTRRGRGASVGAATGGAVAAATTLVAAVLGMGLGGAATYAAMRPDWGEAQAESASMDGSSANGVDAGAARNDDGISPDAALGRARSTGGAPAASPRSALAAAIDQSDLTPPTQPTVTISGRVLTTDGAPLAGAVVRAPGVSIDAEPRPSRRGVVIPQAPLEEQIRAGVIALRTRAASVRTAKTDESGSFVLTHVDARALGNSRDSVRLSGMGVTAQANGYDVRLAYDDPWYDGGPSATIDFVAVATVDVPVQVLQPDGTSARRGRVSWARRAGGVGERRGSGSGLASEAEWTPGSPTVRVEAGAWTFTAVGGPDLRSAPVAATFAFGETPEPVVLQLAPRASIRGSLRLDEPGVDVRRVRITADLRGAGNDAKPIQGGPNRNRDGDLKYALTDLTPGDYDVTVSLDRTPVLTTLVHAPGGPVAQDIVVPAFTPSQVLRVLVSGPDRRWLGGDDVQVRLVQNGGQSAVARVECPTPGTFLVMLPNNASSAAVGSTWRVEAVSRPYGRKSQDVVPGTTTNVAIQFDEPAVLQATLVGATDASIANRVAVTLVKPSDHVETFGVIAIPNGTPRPPTANPTSFTVQPGRYRAVLWLAPATTTDPRELRPFEGIPGAPAMVMPIGGSRVLAEIPVELRSGVNPLTIQVPELRSATVHVSGVPRNTNVGLAPARQPSREMVFDSRAIGEGDRTTFIELPPGTYAASVPGRGEMLFDLPSSGVVEFSPATISGLAVTVESESGALATNGLRTGDVIVSVDGTPVETLSGGTNRLTWAARSLEHVQIEVMRGGRRETLTVDPRGFGSRDLLGGWWEPAKR